MPPESTQFSDSMPPLDDAAFVVEHESAYPHWTVHERLAESLWIAWNQNFSTSVGAHAHVQGRKPRTHYHLKFFMGGDAWYGFWTHN